MLVLGIESTCDETAAALVQDGVRILSQKIASQAEIHNQYGGVVPEIASRHHIQDIAQVIEETFRAAGFAPQDIDLIAVAKGPGLIGSLLVGIQTAKAMAWALKKPLVGVNHVEAHLYAAIMECQDPEKFFPALGLILSGGHSTLLNIQGIGSYTLIGQTVDDALGEAFDKVAKMLKLPYPGGPQVEACAEKGNLKTFSFHAGRVKKQPFSFSFSGLKTAVLYALQALPEEKRYNEETISDLCAAFQHAAFVNLSQKLQKACAEFQPKALFLGGGVTQNKALRSFLQEELSLPLFWPRSELCLDNAAMIAGLGYHVWRRSHLDETFTLEPMTRIEF